jgi:hypothetical protein
MTKRRAGKNLYARLEALERRVPAAPVRVILVWKDREGRLTKAADTHPHLPDSYPYDQVLQQ